MKVATLEKIHLRGGNQDPGDPGVGKVRGGGGFFSFKQGEGNDPGWHYDKLVQHKKTKSKSWMMYAYLYVWICIDI